MQANRIALALLFGWALGLSQGVSQGDINNLDQIVKQSISSLNVRGASITIFNKATTSAAVTRGYGKVSSSSSSSDVTADTAFMTASVSKVFAGMAILKLVDKGVINLDDDICNVIPSDWSRTACRNPSHPNTKVTWRMLATHESSLRGNIPATGGGLDVSYAPDYGYGGSAAGWLTCPMSDVVDFYGDILTDRLRKSPYGLDYIDNWHDLVNSNGGAWLSFKPGTQEEYSNFGVGYIAALTELATGQSFSDFCKDNIFSPLGMSDTAWFRESLPSSTSVAVPTQTSGSGWTDVGHYCFIDYASGQLYTTANDMAKFLGSMKDYGSPALWPKSIGEQAFACQSSVGGCDYGLNWGVLSNLMKSSSYSWLSPVDGTEYDWTDGGEHAGGESGVQTQILVLPQAGIYASVLTNTDGNDEEAAQKIMEQILSWSTSLTSPPGITSGSGWRIQTQSSYLAREKYWDVHRLRFFTSGDCSASSEIKSSSGSIVESGNGGSDYKADYAFQGGQFWGGRGSNGIFWLGLESISPDVTVRCVKLDQREASQITIQVKSGGNWQDVKIATGLLDGDNTIVLSTDTGGGDQGDVESAVGWRLKADSTETAEGWVWDVKFIEFFSSSDCSPSSKIVPSSGTVIDSGNAGENWVPSNAFQESKAWGGRASNKVFWIGLDNFNPAVTVRCTKMKQTGANVANSLSIQGRPSGSNTWQDVYTASSLTVGVNTFVVGTTAPPPGITSGSGWRIQTQSSYLAREKYWDVHRLRFFTSGDCSASSEIKSSSGSIVESGNGGSDYKADYAFQGGQFWGGRGSNGIFWLGLESISPDVTVRCVKLDQREASQITIQVKSGGNWQDVKIATGLLDGDNTIVLSTDTDDDDDDNDDDNSGFAPTFSFQLRTDRYEDEIKAELKVRGSGAVLVSYDPPEKANTLYNNVVVLQNGVQYEICVEDEYGDGMENDSDNRSDDGWVKALKTDSRGNIVTLAEIAGSDYTTGPYCVCFTTSGSC